MLLYLLPTMTLANVAQNDRLQVVRQSIEQGQYNQARQHLSDFMSRHPGDAQARFLQGVLLTHEGRIKQATTVFETLTQEYPRLPEAYNNLAVLYAAQARYEKARDILLAALNTHPSYAKVHENLGEVYAKMASIAYDQALQLNHAQKTPPLKLNLLSHLSTVQNGKKDSAPTSVSNHTSQAQVTTPQAEVPAQRPSVPPQADPPVVTETPRLDPSHIIETIHAWAAAWSKQDVNAYLTFYADNFKPAQGLSRKAWRNQRRLRLRTPRFIKVTLSTPEVTFLPNGTARVQFLQDYASNIFRDKINKQLFLTKHNAKWRIVEERIIRK
jgi:tetratricopeptide (TPR) repeat protein